MTRHANKFYAKRMAGGLEPECLALHAAAGSPDGYHSAKEPSDFDNDTKEELRDVESKEEAAPESDNSDTSSVWSGRDSICTQ